MEKKFKYLVIVVIFFISFSSLVSISFLLQTGNDNNPGENNSERDRLSQVYNITIIIDYSGEKLNEMFDNVTLTNNQTTVYHALINVSTVEEEWYGDRVFINKINGIGPGWVYYVDDDFPGIASNFFNLRNNETIRWKKV